MLDDEYNCICFQPLQNCLFTANACNIVKIDLHTGNLLKFPLLANIYLLVIGELLSIIGSVQGDKDGNAAQAMFDFICDLAVDSNGSLWATDLNNNKIKRISFEGSFLILHFFSQNSKLR